jgi:hypothetical protein
VRSARAQARLHLLSQRAHPHHPSARRLADAGARTGCEVEERCITSGCVGGGAMTTNAGPGSWNTGSHCRGCGPAQPRRAFE